MTEDDRKLNITIDGREHTLTPAQARHVARRMADREAERPDVWAETGMQLLDFAVEEQS